MPIYEFRCSKCANVFEFLSIKSDDEVEMKCPTCGSPDFERVLSTTNYSLGTKSSGGSKGVTAQTRSCGSGSCTTYDIPGYSR